MTEDLKREIAAAISPALTNNGFELIELKLARYGRTSRLQIFIDNVTGEGVTLDDCVKVSRLSDEIMEAKDFFEGEYTLEVSSPGIDRPLHTQKDFVRKIGRKVKIEFNDSGKKQLVGLLKEVSETSVTVQAKKGLQSAKLDEIKVAKEHF